VRASRHGTGCCCSGPRGGFRGASYGVSQPIRSTTPDRSHAWQALDGDASAEAQGASRATGHKWVRRYRLEGPAGLVDRSSRPRHSPTVRRRTGSSASSRPGWPGAGGRIASDRFWSPAFAATCSKISPQTRLRPRPVGRASVRPVVVNVVVKPVREGSQAARARPFTLKRMVHPQGIARTNENGDVG